MSKEPLKPNDVILIDGDDISHLSPVVTMFNGREQELLGFRVVLKKGGPKGIRITVAEAGKIILDSMRGKRFEAVRAIKWHYVGRERKGGRETMITTTNEDQVLDMITEGVENGMGVHDSN